MLKPWREVIIPHKDVASGKYQQAEFAADLAQVLAGNAEPEYQDANEFFNRTYLTEGMKLLLASSLKRSCNINGEPVIQLKTAFGGGKTHTMLALYHIFNDKSIEKHEVVRSVLDFVQIEKIRVGNNITRTWKYEGDKIIISNKTRLSWEKRLSQNNFIIL